MWSVRIGDGCVVAALDIAIACVDAADGEAVCFGRVLGVIQIFNLGARGYGAGGDLVKCWDIGQCYWGNEDAEG